MKIKRVKVLTAIILSMTIVLTTVPCSIIADSNNSIVVTLDGSPIQFEQPPIIENGRTLVPLRAIFEALGATVEWDNATRTVVAIKENTTIIMQINNNTMQKNSQPIELEVAPVIFNGTTLVPTRAVAESFGVNVTWDGDTRTVILNTSQPINRTITDYELYPGIPDFGKFANIEPNEIITSTNNNNILINYRLSLSPNMRDEYENMFLKSGYYVVDRSVVDGIIGSTLSNNEILIAMTFKDNSFNISIIDISGREFDEFRMELIMQQMDNIEKELANITRGKIDNVFEAWLMGDPRVSEEDVIEYLQNREPSNHEPLTGTMLNISRIPTTTGNVYMLPMEIILKAVAIGHMNVLNPDRVRMGATARVDINKLYFIDGYAVFDATIID